MKLCARASCTDKIVAAATSAATTLEIMDYLLPKTRRENGRDEACGQGAVAPGVHASKRMLISNRSAGSALELTQRLPSRDQAFGVGVGGNLDQRSLVLDTRLAFGAGGVESRDDCACVAQFLIAGCQQTIDRRGMRRIDQASRAVTESARPARVALDGA